MSTRYQAFLAAVATLLMSGAVYYALAGDSDQLDDAASRVALVPMDIGAWHAQDVTGEEKAFAQTGAKSYWIRNYVNHNTKASVLAILMCGRAGKMAVHTPEVCYSGAGYQLQDQAAQCRIADDRFWTGQFAKPSGHLRLHWAWNAHGAWEASASPRWQFRGAPFLYKLYVSREIVGPPSATPQADVTAEFLREFMPVLNRTLFPPN